MLEHALLPLNTYRLFYCSLAIRLVLLHVRDGVFMFGATLIRWGFRRDVEQLLAHVAQSEAMSLKEHLDGLTPQFLAYKEVRLLVMALLITRVSDARDTWR